MKTIKKHQKILLITLISVLVVIISIFAYLLLSQPEKWEPAQTTGEAEAVLTTPTRVLDGIWDPRRYSDELYYPIGIAMAGNDLVVADSMCDRIVILDGESNKRIGRPGQYGLSYYDSGALIDGYRENALFMKPSDVAVSPNGEIIICDTGNNVVRRMDDDLVTTIAGNGQSGYANGKEGEVRFNAPRSATVAKDGTIYVADTMNHCIRRIDTDGNVTLFAGVPEESGYADGTAAHAKFHEPSGIVISDTGEIFVADSGNHSIRKISDGIVTTIAGEPGEIDRVTGYSPGGYTDGINSEARLNFPRDLALLPDGRILVADTMNHAIRLIDGEKTMTIAGNGIADRYYLSAENLRLTRPEGICTDGEEIYISDSVNNRIVVLPITERIMQGRPTREEMLAETGMLTDSRYSYNSDIRIFIESERIDMGRVQPWNTMEQIYLPIRPLFEALGATVTLDDNTDVLTITVNNQDTILNLNKDYFIMKGVATTTAEEMMRLFPYTFEWFPEFSLIALHIPQDMVK